jgi:hypothetical protein
MQLDFPKPKIVKEITDILMIVGLRESAAGTNKDVHSLVKQPTTAIYSKQPPYR